MPYIPPEKRKKVFDSEVNYLAAMVEETGDLNYIFSRLVTLYVVDHGGLGYANLSATRAALTDASDEFYARVMRPWEDYKCTLNGDVYDELLEAMREVMES
jgi:hypothetical protein